MSSAEITEWMAYYSIEPFGSGIDLLGNAIVASTIANINRKKGAKAYKPSDFIPKFKKKKQTVEEMLQFAEMMTAGLGGTVKTHEDTD